MGLAAVVEEDVGGFEIPVDDAVGVGVGHGSGHLGHDGHAVGQTHGVGADRLLQRPPRDVGHGEVRLAVLLSQIQDRHDVRVAQPGGGLRLADEPADGVLSGELSRQHHFQGDRALE